MSSTNAVYTPMCVVNFQFESLLVGFKVSQIQTLQLNKFDSVYFTVIKHLFLHKFKSLCWSACILRTLVLSIKIFIFLNV